MQDVEIYCPYCKVTHTCALKEKLVYTTFNLIPIKYEVKFYECPTQVRLGEEYTTWEPASLVNENRVAARLAYGKEIQKRANS